MNSETRQIENESAAATHVPMFRYTSTAYDAERLATSANLPSGAAFYAFSFDDRTVGFVGPNGRDYEICIYATVKRHCLVRKLW